MSKQISTGAAGKVGRPATGKTTQTIRASVPVWLAEESKQAAFDIGATYSGFIARALQAALLRSRSKP